MAAKALTQYLARYAEPELEHLQTFPTNHHYHNVLVVPFYDEASDSLDTILAAARIDSPTLIIAIINSPPPETTGPSNTVDSPYIRTQELLTKWQQQFTRTWFSGPLSVHTFADAVDLLLVDRCSPGQEIPRQQGVGLARKIGNDLACALITQKKINAPWIHNTDADVSLPADYFIATESLDNGAAVYPFRHIACDPAWQTATELYELSLHYYVEGLRWAGSPYAYHTIGSIVAIHHMDYAKVRGFPKRPGAEDFYLLNKINKVSGVNSLSKPAITIQGRPSHRVPFGTGPGLLSLEKMDDALSEYRFYHPEIFSLLKLWLTAIPLLWEKIEHGPPGHNHNVLSDFLPEAMTKTLIQMDVGTALSHAQQQASNQAAFTQQLHTWFDGFRTLQLIHRLRDGYYPSIPIGELAGNVPFMSQVPFIDQTLFSGQKNPGTSPGF